MPSLYVGAKLPDYDLVIAIQERFRRLGFTIPHDWASDFKKYGPAPLDAKSTFQDEIEAVTTVDYVLFFLPGGRGMHVELGAAYAANRQIVIYMPIRVEPIGFYYLEGVTTVRTIDDAVDEIIRRALMR